MVKNFKIFIGFDSREKIAYQAPEARSFFFKKKECKILNEYFDNLNKLKLQNKRNVINLSKKIRDPLSSKRLGFRENMAFIMGLSYFILNKSLKTWSGNG